MKTIFTLVSLLLMSSFAFSQSNSCEDLKEAVEENASLENSYNCIGSSALLKVEYYTFKGDGYVIAYLKSNNYDSIGKAYIFCGISSSRWSKFVSEGRYNSWGKAFSAYIKEFQCNCN